MNVPCTFASLRFIFLWVSVTGPHNQRNNFSELGKAEKYWNKTPNRISTVFCCRFLFWPRIQSFMRWKSIHSPQHRDRVYARESAKETRKKQLSFLSFQFLFCVVFISSLLIWSFFLFEKLLNCSCGTLSAGSGGSIASYCSTISANGSCWFQHSFADTMNSILMALWLIVCRMAVPSTHSA